MNGSVLKWHCNTEVNAEIMSMERYSFHKIKLPPGKFPGAAFFSFRRTIPGVAMKIVSMERDSFHGLNSPRKIPGAAFVSFR